MKTKFIFLLQTLLLFSIAKSFAQQKDTLTNPYWLEKSFENKGYHFLSSGPIEIGKGGVGYHGSITHAYKTITVTLPEGVSLKNIYPFIFNTGCLKGPGGEPMLIPWGYIPDIDYRYGTFHQPALTTDKKGRQVVSVQYDNWSNCDPRLGYLIVMYEK